MEQKCPVCRGKYEDDGDSWKRVCYDCYKTFSFLIGYRGHENPSRIKSCGHKCNIYLSHHDVSNEEMDAFIKEKGYTQGWGAEEWSPNKWGKYKIWVDNVSFD